MAIRGRTPKLDPVTHDAEIREIREAVRFADRPGLRGLAARHGFKSHRHLYFIAEAYERRKGLAPDEREPAEEVEGEAPLTKAEASTGV